MADPGMGSNARVVIDFEDSWNTAKTGGDIFGRKLSVVTCDVRPAQDLIDNPSIGGDLNPREPVAGRKSAAGPMVIIPGVKTLPFLTKWLTGNLSYSAGPPKTHTSKLTSTVPPSCVIETDYLFGATHKYGLAKGTRINTLAFDLAPDGLLQFNMDLLAADVTYGDTEYDATPTDWSDDGPLDHLMLASTEVKIDNSAVGYIAGGNISFNANLDGNDYRVGGEGARGSLVPGRYAVEGTLRLVLDDAAVLTFITGGGAFDIDLLWNGGTNEKLALALPNCIRSKTGPGLAGPGALTGEIRFRAAYQIALGSSFQFITTNSQVDTDYA